MHESTQTGMNRTGTQIAPQKTRSMVEAAQELTDDIVSSDLTVDEVRQEYTTKARAIGSVPIPASLKSAGMTLRAQFKGMNPAVFIDKLGERLAFERTGVRLYEALITKVEAEGLSAPSLEVLRQFQSEELKHFEMVRAAIEKLGADPTAQTPCADTNGVQAMGLIQVVTDPRTTVLQSLNAILTAELADRDGWDLLIQIAEHTGQEEIARNFRIAFEEEENHLAVVRGWFQKLTFQDLGKRLEERH